MPLTEKGEKIKQNMEKQYGEKKGESVFYASANKGTIKGVHNDDVTTKPVNPGELPHTSLPDPGAVAERNAPPLPSQGYFGAESLALQKSRVGRLPVTLGPRKPSDDAIPSGPTPMPTKHPTVIQPPTPVTGYNASRKGGGAQPSYSSGFQLPNQVSHADIKAQSRKYGGW